MASRWIDYCLIGLGLFLHSAWSLLGVLESQSLKCLHLRYVCGFVRSNEACIADVNLVVWLAEVGIVKFTNIPPPKYYSICRGEHDVLRHQGQGYYRVPRECHLIERRKTSKQVTRR